MKKAVYAVIPAAALLFASCEFWNEPVKDFFDYWASEAYISGWDAGAAKQNDSSGVTSIASGADGEILLKANNPKNFRFVMPTAGNSEMIKFTGLSTQPVPGTDYTLTQLSSDTLKLTYKSAFLKQYEWGTGDFGADLTLYADDGRKFSRAYSFNLKANTPPPTPSLILAQTNPALPAQPHYVFCLKVPDMTVMVNGERLHKDIAKIKINDDEYPLAINGANNDFAKPSDAHFIDRSLVVQLAETGSAIPPAASEQWILYYDTGVETGDRTRAYTVNLKDDKGLVSNTLDAKTSLNEPPAETVSITKGEQVAGTGTSNTDPIILKGDTSTLGSEIQIQNIAGTIVHCTVTDVVAATTAQYDANPVTFELGLGSTNEKLYKVEYHTTGDGFKPSAVKTKYYRVLKQHTVTFDANGGTYTGGTTYTALVAHTMTATPPAGTANPTRQGYTFGSWYKEAACTTQWNFTTDTVTGDTTLYAQWNPASGTGYKVEHYQEKTDGVGQYPASPHETDNLTGTTGHTFTTTEIDGMKKTTYQGFEFDRQDPASPSIAADGTTIIKLYYKRKTVQLTFNLDGGNIGGSTTTQTRSGRFGTTFTAPTNPVKTGYTFSSWQPTPPAPALSSTFPAANAEYTAKWTANTYTVRFNVYGGPHGTLKANPEGGTEKTTSTTDTVSVEHGKKVTFTAQPDEGYEVDSWTGATADTPNTTATLLNVTTDNINVTVKFKKKTYNVTFSVEGGEGSLKGEGGGHINMADGTAPETLTVPYGENVDFTATPKSEAWKVAGWMKNNAEVNGTNATYTLSNVTENTTVKVRFYQPEIAGSTTAWRDLLSAVRNAPANATITINGEIKATHISGNNGEIVINKNLTIKGSDKSTDILNAVTLSRIFKVKTGNTLTLENITLKNGGKTVTEDGGGIYSEGTLTLNNTTIESCGAKNGGGIYAQGGAEITLTHTEINGCVAKENGGGLYIKDSRLTLDNATIGGEQLCIDNQPNKAKGNKAKNGGGIFLTGSGTAGSTMTGGKVSYNLATDTSEAKGGGIYIQESASFTMQSGNINSNKVATGTVEEGGGVYVCGQGSGSGTHASFTLNRGTIGDNAAGFGGGVMVTAGGKFTMNNGTMSENRANYGGGVCAKNADYTDGVFTMQNGTITGNRAYQDGGAVEVHGVFTWEGGSITGNHVNTAPRGQIIHKDGGHFYNNCHGTAS